MRQGYRQSGRGAPLYAWRMSHARIAAVRYLNTAPLIEGLESVQGLTLLPAVPADIIGMLERKEADVGLASIIDAAAAKGPMALLPVGMIGCDGPTMTVRLFSTRPFGEITLLHADADSHTSVVLARVLLKRVHGVAAKVETFQARERLYDGPERWPEAVLLIGDKVVRDAPPAERYPHQMDLGEAWKALTGLPFVYAMWMCRAEDADLPEIRLAASLLDRQRRHNAMRMDWIVQTRAPAAGWPIEQAQHYLGRLLRYTVGDREREAVRAFLAEAAAIGACPKVLPRWVDV